MWVCPQCGKQIKGTPTPPIRCRCKLVDRAPQYHGSDPVPKSKRRGAGTELAKILEWFWIKGEGCDCKKHAAEMDRQGPDWCEGNIDTIVGWLHQAAKQRGMVFRLAAKLPGANLTARQAVRLAIYRARSNQIKLRNLIYHVCPLASNDLWRRNIEQLTRRWDVFNGRKVIAIATGRGTLSAATVEAMIGRPDVEYLRIQNDRQLREVVSFRQLLDAIRNAKRGEATFYGHTKGNATLESMEAGITPEDRILGATRWRNAMYHHLLDRSDECMQALESYTTVGTTKLAWGDGNLFKFPSGLMRGNWMLAGTFFWFRHDRVFGDARWRDIPNDRYGAESWLPGFVDGDDAYSMFQPWRPTQLPLGSPYNPAYYPAEFDD